MVGRDGGGGGGGVGGERERGDRLGRERGRGGGGRVEDEAEQPPEALLPAPLPACLAPPRAEGGVATPCCLWLPL